MESEESGSPATTSCVTLPICGFPYNTITSPHHTTPSCQTPQCVVPHGTPDPMIRHAKPSASPFVGFSPQSAAPCHGSSGGAKDTTDFATTHHRSIKAATLLSLSLQALQTKTNELRMTKVSLWKAEDNDSLQTVQ